MQLSRIIFRNSLFGVAANVIIKVLSFAFAVYSVRFLGADAVGQFVAVMAFGRVFIFLSDLGLSPYTVREVARLREQPGGAERIAQLYGAVLRLRTVLALFTAGLVLALAWMTSRPAPMIGAIALNMVGLLLFGVQGTSEAILAGYERLDVPSKAKVYNQICYIVLGGLALWAGLGYYGLIIATLAGIVLMLWLCWRAVSALEVRPGVGAGWPWWMLIRTSMPFGVISLALGLSYNLDVVLLNIFRSTTETAYYGAAYGLVFSVLFLSNAVNTALFPSLSRQSVSQSHTLPPIYERCLSYLLILSLPIAVGATVLSEPLVQFLYGPSYQPVVPVLQIVIWVVPLMFASEFLGYIVVISDRERYVARAIVISTCLNVMLNLLLIPRFGLYTAAVMTVVTELVLVGQYLWLLRHTLARFNWQFVLLRPLLAALIMGWAVHLLRALPVILTVLSGMLIYGMLLLLLGVLGKEEFRFVRGLRPGGVEP